MTQIWFAPRAPHENNEGPRPVLTHRGVVVRREPEVVRPAPTSEVLALDDTRIPRTIANHVKRALKAGWDVKVIRGTGHPEWSAEPVESFSLVLRRDPVPPFVHPRAAFIVYQDGKLFSCWRSVDDRWREMTGPKRSSEFTALTQEGPHARQS